LYENIASEYVRKVEELLACESFSFRDVTSEQVPKEPGVYVIFNERDKIIYVGRTRNLGRRLLGDHKNGNIRGSQFRRALMQNYGLKSEGEISKFIQNNCAFKFKVIEEPEERIRLEHFTTAITAPQLNIKIKQ